MIVVYISLSVTIFLSVTDKNYRFIIMGKMKAKNVKTREIIMDDDIRNERVPRKEKVQKAKVVSLDDMRDKKETERLQRLEISRGFDHIKVIQSSDDKMFDMMFAI